MIIRFSLGKIRASKGPSGPSSGGARFTKSSSSGPISFAKATSTFGTTGITSTGILEEDDHELDPSAVEKGGKREGLTASTSSGSVGEMKETAIALTSDGVTQPPMLRVSMARENTGDSVTLETAIALTSDGVTQPPMLRVSMARENTGDSVTLEHPYDTLAIV